MDADSEVVTITRAGFEKFIMNAIDEMAREFPGGDNESYIYRMLVALNNAAEKSEELIVFAPATLAIYERETAE